MRSATSELLPWAMLANGPQCIRHGWPSSVWMRLGFSASLSSTAIAPAAPRSSAVIGARPLKDCATVMAPRRRRRSCRSRDDGHDRHDLGGRGDVEAALARIAVGAAAERDGDLAQGAVVHVHRPAPADAQRVDVQRVAVQDRGVEHRREQVVGRADGVDVAGEVQVEVLHRDDLRHAAARGAALDAEHRPERGLAQAGDRALADDAEALRQPDQRRRLALAGLGRRHARHAHELAVGRLVHALEHAEIDLRLVAPVGLELLVLEPDFFGDLLDRLEDRVLCDLEAALHDGSMVG